MQIIYALINFLLLAGIVFLVGRKKIVAIFRDRRLRVESELDAAEAESSLPKPLPAEPCRREAAALSDPTEELERASEELERGLKARFEHDREDFRRTMLASVRSEFIREVQEKVRERMTTQPLCSQLRAAEGELVDSVLNRIKLTSGDMAYLIKSPALYVTLTSAYLMPEDIVHRIDERMSAMLEAVGSKISLRTTVDESLLGGFSLRVGDTIYDCSVADRIYHLGRTLSKQPVDTDDADKMIAELMQAIATDTSEIDVYQVGRVISVSDGICWLDGLSDIVYGGVVEFACGERGMIMDIQQDRIACIIFGQYEHIESYSRVRRLGEMASIPVGEAMLGRVVDPLGRPIDGKGRIWTNERRMIECGAPSIPDRKSVATPLHTGIKLVDALVPIGLGQRELIIGDRQTGKTSLAVDAIISQKGRGIQCVYVAIGQKEATVAEIVSKLEKYGAMEYTTVVCATASDSASLQYIAPFSGAAMCEYFMYSGSNSLIVYDDLSKHAVAYRELSLLMHKPSGREAYPGDIFYLHARLLERAAQLSDEAGGGSMTALPIIETQAGDISAYIPTNVISITDGQIFLESELFNEGQRPAVNVGLSVSRVGSAAQTKLMKQVSSRLRMELAQYRELQTFAQFGSELDEATKKVLDAGARMMAALRQGRYLPLADWKQALLIYAVAEGFAAATQPENMDKFESALFARFEAEHGELVRKLSAGGKMDEETRLRVKQALSALPEVV